MSHHDSRCRCHCPSGICMALCIIVKMKGTSGHNLCCRIGSQGAPDSRSGQLHQRLLTQQQMRHLSQVHWSVQGQPVTAFQICLLSIASHTQHRQQLLISPWPQGKGQPQTCPQPQAQGISPAWPQSHQRRQGPLVQGYWASCLQPLAWGRMMPNSSLEQPQQGLCSSCKPPFLLSLHRQVPSKLMCVLHPA